jgi:hypothetical protein
VPMFLRYNKDNKVIEAVYHYTSNEDDEEEE